MKTVRFLFTTTACGALAVGLSFAEPPGREPHQTPSESHTTTDSHRLPDEGHDAQAHDKTDRTDGSHPDEKRDNKHTPDKGSHASALRHHPGQERLKTIQHNRAYSGVKRTNDGQAASTSENRLYQSGLSTSMDAAKNVLMMNTIGRHRVQPARPPVGGGFTMPSPNAFHRRGAGPAIAGGGVNSSVGSTAAINGTGMRHKP